MPITLLRSALAALCLLTALAGCKTMVDIPDIGLSSQFIPEVYAQELTEMDAGELGARLTQMQAAWEKHKTAANQAQLGLTRGQWGYAGYAPAQAAEEIKAAIKQSGTYWSASERAFLQFQASRLQHAAQREQQMTAASQQNDHLRKELEQARAKLQAIGKIESEMSNQHP